MAPFGETVGLVAEAEAGRRDPPAGRAASRRRDRGADRGLAGEAEDPARRGGEIRRLPARPCRARRLRHRDAGTRPRRRADGRRLSRRSDRARAEALPERAVDRAGESGPRRERRPGIPRRRERRRSAGARDAGAALGNARPARAARRASRVSTPPWRSAASRRATGRPTSSSTLAADWAGRRAAAFSGGPEIGT